MLAVDRFITSALLYVVIYVITAVMVFKIYVFSINILLYTN